MPSPIAHSVTGLVIYKLLHNKQSVIWNKPTYVMVLCMFIAVLPDLDFILQLWTGRKYHHTFTHSITLTILFALVSAIICSLLNKHIFRITLCALIGYGSHLVLDFFTEGGRGIQLFWPFSEKLFISPATFFPGTHHSKGLFSRTHFTFISFELLYSLILLTGLYIWEKRKYALE